MFEQGLSYLLKSVLCDFVEDGDYLHEKVQVGVWSGFIVLENLVLKNSILSLVDVPISLSYGYIGRLEIRIPWSRLGSEPVTIVVDKINILIEPKYEWNPGAADRREQAIKQAKLAAAEIFANQRFETSNTASNKYRDLAKNWFLNAFLGKIMDNIQITLREVHIRYEDRLSCPSDFCIGFSFESLHLQSRDPKGHYDDGFSPSKASTISDSTRNYEKEMNFTGADAFHKLIELNHLAVYWNPMVSKGLDVCCCSFIGRSTKEIQSLMSRTIVTRVCKQYDRPRHHYILQPVDINVFLDMAVNVGTGTTKANARVFISEISIHLEDRQLREIISMALNMSNFSKLERFSEFRPTCSVSQGPKLWWQYAINAVLVQLRLERKRKCNRKQFTQHIHDKLVYMELWKSRMMSSQATIQQINSMPYEKPQLDRENSTLYQMILSNAQRIRKERQGMHEDDSITVVSAAPMPLDEERIRLLKALEYELSFEDLLLFRSLAEKNMSLEARKQSWLGSIFTWASGGKASAVSDEERRKLFEALKYDPDKLFRGGSKEADPDEVMSIVSVYLKEGSITLALSSPDTSSTFQTAIPFLQIKLLDLRSKNVIMGDGSHVRVNLSLQDIEGYEMYPSTQRNKKLQLDMVYHRFIFRRNLKTYPTNASTVNDMKTMETESNISFSEDKSVMSTSTRMNKAAMEKQDPPLFVCAVELSPNNKDVEVSVKLEMDELEVWFSPTAKWIDSVGIFSAWPEDLKYWSEMEMKAMNQLADLKSRINAKLEYVMNNHSNVVIEGKVRAPVVIIHDKPSSSLEGKTNLLVVDLGQVSLHTEKLAKAQRNKDLEAISQFTVAASNLLQASTMSTPGHQLGNLDANSKGWEMLPATEVKKRSSEDIQSSVNDNQDLDLLLGALADDNKSYVDEGHNREGRRSSLFHKYTSNDNKRNSNLHALNEAAEFDSNEEELFDVFQCQITQLEVYLVEAIVVRDHHGSGNWSAHYDSEKTTIVPKFEIGVEIQVSALPWDITLPPVKLFVEIPEINVQLSEAKLIRLAQFGADLAQGSSAFMEANMIKIQKLNDAMSRSQQQQESRVGSNGRLSIGSRQGRTRYPGKGRRNHRRSRSFGGSVTSKTAPSESDYYDSRSEVGKPAPSVISDYRSTYSDTRSAGELSQRMRDIEDGGDMVKSQYDAGKDDEESDDESFFSLEDHLDSEEQHKALEDLKYVIAQRESIRTKLITDIRVTEVDPTKTALHENLKQELHTLEMDLHQLKINYVEMMMQQNDYLQALENDRGDRNADPFYDPDFFKERVETIMSPNLDKAGVGHKRDLIHASVFKLSAPDAGPQMLDFLGPNKELVYVRLNIAQVNVDVQVDVPKNTSESSNKRDSFQLKSAIETISTTYRFSLSEIGLKLRHRVHNSRISLYLRDINILEQTLASSRLRRDDFAPVDTVPFFTSDPSFSSIVSIPMHTRPYTSLGSNEFLRVKYEVTYHRERIYDENGDAKFLSSASHNVSVHVGYMAVNVDQQRLVPLANWGIQMQSNLDSVMSSKTASSSNLTSQQTGDADLSSDSITSTKPSFKIELPSVDASLRIDCIAVSILRGSSPLTSLHVTGISLKSRCEETSGVVGIKVADVSIYNLTNVNNKLYHASRLQDNNMLGARNMVFGRNANDHQTPFFTGQLSLDLKKVEGSSDVFPKVKGSLKVAALGFIVDNTMICELIRESTKGPLVLLLQRIAAEQEYEKQHAAPQDCAEKEHVERTLLLDQIGKWVKSSGGNINISSGGFQFVVPSLPKYNKEEAIDLVFGMHQIKSRLRWGADSCFNGIEAALSISEIGMKLATHDIIRKFEIHASIKCLPSTCIVVDVNHPSNRVKSLEWNTAYPPEKLDEIQGNEIQISASISPIVAVCNKGLIYTSLTWVKSLEEMLDQISRTIDNGSKSIVESAQKIKVGSQAESPFNLPLDFVVKSHVRIHHMSVHADYAALPIINSPPRYEESKFEFGSTSSPKRGNLSMEVPSVWHGGYFAFTMCNINIASRLFPRDNFDFISNSFSNHMVESDVTIDSLVAEEVDNLGESTLMICSGCKQGNLPSSERISLTPFMSLSLHIFHDLSININSSMAELNVVYLPNTISRLMDMVVYYLDKTGKGQTRSIPNPIQKNSKSSTNTTRVTGDEQAAHPSSVPMSPASDQPGTELTEVEEKPTGSTLFNFDVFRSFAIPYLRCEMTFHGFQLWMPLMNLEQVKNTTALCATIAINLFAEYQQPNYLALVDLDANEEQVLMKWFTVNFTSDILGVYLADQVPTFFTEKSNPDSVQGEISPVPGCPLTLVLPGEEHHFPNFLSDSSTAQQFISMVKPKVWLAQLECCFAFTAFMSTEISRSELAVGSLQDDVWSLIEQPYNVRFRALLEGHIPRVELQCFMDYRPYIKMFENTIKPIIEKAEKDFGSKPNGAIKPDSRKDKTQNQSDWNSAMDGRDIVHLSSADEVFSHLPEICEISVIVKIDSVTVIVLNDLYQQPISLARVSLSDTSIEVSCPLPPRTQKFVVIERRITMEDAVINESEYESAQDITPKKSIAAEESNLSLLDQARALAHSPLSVMKSKVVRFEDSPSKRRQSDALVPANNASVTTSKDDLALAKNYVEAVIVHVRSNLSVDYQNQKLIAIEPLIEPVAISIDFEMFRSTEVAHQPLVHVVNNNLSHDYFDYNHELISDYFDKLNAQVGEKPENEEQEIISIPPPSLSVIVDQVNINVTMALLEIVFLTVKSLDKLQVEQLDDFSHVSNSNEMSLLTIRNDSGVQLKYWSNDDQVESFVPSNAEQPLKVSSYSESFLSGFNTSSHSQKKIFLALQHPQSGFWPAIKDVSLEGVGCRLFALSEEVDEQGHKKKKSQKMKPVSDPALLSTLPSVVLDLVSRNGSKILTVRSTMRIYNSTLVAFNIKLVDSSSSGTAMKKKEILWEAFLQPGRGVFIPAHLCNLNHAQFLVTTFKARLARKKSNTTHVGGLSESEVQDHLAVSNVEKSGIGEFPCPEILGVSKNSTNNENETESSSGSAKDADTSLPRNQVKWRRKWHQQRGVVNTLSYFHWLSLREQIVETTASSKANGIQDVYSRLAQIYEHSCCNISVESRGMPLKKHQLTSSSMLRTLTIAPPVTIVNLMGSEIIVALTPDLDAYGFYSGDVSTQNNSLEQLFDANPELKQIIPQHALRPGESNQSLAIHATESFYLSIQLAHEVSSVQDTWSTFIRIPGCADVSQQQSTSNYSVDVVYKNGSKLTIQLEVIDKGGCRVVNCFVPFWIVSSSFIPLQFQHDSKAASSSNTSKAFEQYLNGVDGLAPDQPFEERKQLRSKIKEGDKGKNSKVARDLPRGVGKARGINGIVLGPDVPLKGLPDVLHPIVMHNSSMVSPLSPKLPSTPSSADSATAAARARLMMLQDGTVMEEEIMPFGDNFSEGYEHQTLTTMKDSVSSLTMHQRGSTTSLAFSNMTNSAMPARLVNSNFNLIQVNYTNREKRQGRIRFRHRNTHWSSILNLESSGERSVALDSLAKVEGDDNDDGNRSVNSPFFKEGKKTFNFGVTVQALDAPFQRTKVIMLVDRYEAVNMVGQSIEVKQFQQDNIFTIRSKEEVPLWWRPGPRILQIRLARYGWSWSGKFSVDQDEGEIPVRLRNDYDNTVYFVLICIMKQGGKVSIVFKGGDKFSPYRFENHTVETFRIRQQQQNQFTNLLPYHCCAYAWDEPLATHRFTISILKNALQSQDDWEEIGSYSFDRLEYLQLNSKTSKHLMMRIVAQGPTRVLQIYDTRLMHLHSSLSAPSMPMLAAAASSSSNNAMTSGAQTVLKRMMNFHIACNIKSLGISMVDPTPEELMYIAFTGIAVEHSIYNKHNVTSIAINRLQVDNQLWSTPYPSMIYPLMPLPSGDSTASKVNKPFIAVNVTQDFEYDGVIFLPAFKFEISPFDINLEGTIIARMVNMASYCMEAFSEISIPSAAGGNNMIAGSRASNTSFSYYDWMDALSNTPWAIHANQKKVSNSQIQMVVDTIHRLYRHQSPPGMQRSHVFRSGRNASNDVVALYGHDYSQSLSKYYIQQHMEKTKLHRDALQQPSAKVYIQKFDISQIKLNISFNPVVSADVAPLEFDSLLMGAINAILLAIGSSFAKIDNCPLRFQPFSAQHIFATSKSFSDQIVSNYALQAVKQAYLVLFSSEILGNPVQLVQRLSEGLWDFMYMPTVGLFTSPEAFILGAFRGTDSLVRTVVASLCSTAGHLANSLQVGLIALGVVDSYPTTVLSGINAIESGDKKESSLPTTPSSNQLNASMSATSNSNAVTTLTVSNANKTRKISRPNGLYESLKMGLIGIVLDPILGFREDGVRGLIVGSAKGGVGLLGRPLYGALGFTSVILEKISFHLLPRFLAHQKLRLVRSRPPRFLMSANMPLQVYSADENIGQELLSRVQQGAYRHEGYLWHGHLQENRQLLLTKARILLLEDHLEFTEVLWQCSIKSLMSIEIDYGHSTTRNQQEEMKRNMETALRLMANDKTSADQQGNSTSNTFRSLLQGEPVLHFYHMPHSDGSSRESPMSPGGTLPTSRSSSNLSALSASGTRSAGLRMAIQQIRFVDHEQLLKMLNHLLRLAPGLASPDVLTYLKAAGVDIDAIISNMAKQFKSPTIQRSGGVASAAWPSSASPHRSLPNPIRLALPSNPSWESVQSTTTTSQSVVIDSAIIHNPALLAMRDEVMSNTTHDEDEEDASSTFKGLKTVEELN